MYTHVPVHTDYMRYEQQETLGNKMYATATQRIQVPSVSDVLDFMRSSETKRSITLRTRCRCNNTPIYAHVNADKKHCSGIFTLVVYYIWSKKNNQVSPRPVHRIAAAYCSRSACSAPLPVQSHTVAAQPTWPRWYLTHENTYIHKYIHKLIKTARKHDTIK
jgi:hypothetical protein